MSNTSQGPVFESQPGWGGQLGDWLNRNKLYVIPAAVIIVLLLIWWAAASKSNKPENLLANPSPSTTFTVEKPSGGTETVRKGDSYTAVARRAITTVIAQATQYTNGARLYAETKLAADLKTQTLKAGATITYSADAITKYLAEYNNLLASQKAKWESWARNIKF